MHLLKKVQFFVQLKMSILCHRKHHSQLRTQHWAFRQKRNGSRLYSAEKIPPKGPAASCATTAFTSLSAGWVRAIDGRADGPRQSTERSGRLRPCREKKSYATRRQRSIWQLLTAFSTPCGQHPQLERSAKNTDWLTFYSSAPKILYSNKAN